MKGGGWNHHDKAVFRANGVDGLSFEMQRGPARPGMFSPTNEKDAKGILPWPFASIFQKGPPMGGPAWGAVHTMFMAMQLAQLGLLGLPRESFIEGSLAFGVPRIICCNVSHC